MLAPVESQVAIPAPPPTSDINFNKNVCFRLKINFGRSRHFFGIMVVLDLLDPFFSTGASTSQLVLALVLASGRKKTKAKLDNP